MKLKEGVQEQKWLLTVQGDMDVVSVSPHIALDVNGFRATW